MNSKEHMTQLHKVLEIRLNHYEFFEQKNIVT